MKEAISKYNIIGSEYVKLDDLNELIRDMQKKVREGKEPGYMGHTKEQAVAVDVMLGHLRVILNKERNFDGILCKIMKTRFEREAREKNAQTEDVENVLKKAEQATQDAQNAIDRVRELTEKIVSGDSEDDGNGYYVVCRHGKTPQDTLMFREWSNGIAVVGRDAPMYFAFRGMAQKVAEKLGDDWRVMDMSPEACERTQRLMNAIFGENEPEYHGDGTKAEDEDWDGEEGE